MRVMPLAADSLGARSMATYVEAGALRLLIDPGVTWRRAGTASPRPRRRRRGAGPRASGSGYAVRATHVAVSHFRADHFRTDASLYAGRRVWAKDPRRAIDRHQASQGRVLAGDPPARHLEPAEGQQVEVDGVTIASRRRSRTARTAPSSGTSWR